MLWVCLIYSHLCLLPFMLLLLKMMRILKDNGFPPHHFFPLLYYMDFLELMRNERNPGRRKKYEKILHWQGRIWIFLLVGDFLILSTHYIIRKIVS
jgi:hypothetical protein